MTKFLKWTFFILAGLAVVLFAGFKVLQIQTKKHSPEETVSYKQEGNELVVFYNRPSKKGRQVFGELVPYGQVWRTGANEATTFFTEKRINFGGKSLPPGEYTLWTIPGTDQWQVIINKKQYPWGVNLDGTATREPEADVLQVEVPAGETEAVTEQFTIDFEGSGSNPEMVLRWDRTEVRIPVSW